MIKSPQGIQRRVTGYHDIRMDGATDLLLRARGMSVMDVGCNRGMVGFEFACNGAKLVHGCDIYAPGIEVAKQIFADLRSVESQFEAIDLSEGPKALSVFNDQMYDVVLMLAVYHKLKRIMSQELLDELVEFLGKHVNMYFVARATENDAEGNLGDRKKIDSVLNRVGMKCMHWSNISEMGPIAIWSR
jgi:2-polyprenyl-3-methyl-5-hydroxy-6-metoxy-1,4-benzoquinol methylase